MLINFSRIFILFCIIFATLICDAVLGSILDTVPSAEHKMPLFPYSGGNGRGRMIEKPRRRLKPKSTTTTLKPEELNGIRQKRSESTTDSASYLQPLEDAIFEVALSQEQLPLDRYPKRSRNRVSEGF